MLFWTECLVCIESTVAQSPHTHKPHLEIVYMSPTHSTHITAEVHVQQGLRHAMPLTSCYSQQFISADCLSMHPFALIGWGGLTTCPLSIQCETEQQQHHCLLSQSSPFQQPSSSCCLHSTNLFLHTPQFPLCASIYCMFFSPSLHPLPPSLSLLPSLLLCLFC